MTTPAISVAVLRRTDAAIGWLRPEELSRASAMAAHRAWEFLRGRGLLRWALESTGTSSGRHIDVVNEHSGRPILAPPTTLGVSITHDAGVVAVAVGTGVDVGIDAQGEVARPDRLIARCCSPIYRERITRMPADDRSRAFAAVWVVQEACVKATGRGLAGTPWRIPVDPDAPRGRAGDVWWLRLPPVEGVSLAVAVRGRGVALAGMPPVTVLDPAGRERAQP